MTTQTALVERRGYLLIPTNRIRRYPDQPRIYIEPQALLDLQRSIEEIGQRRAIIVKVVTDDPEHDYELIDGERRWICCTRLEIEKMKAVIEEPEDDDDQFMTSVAANIPPELHTPLEIAKAIDRIRKSKRMKNVPLTEVMKRIGALFGRDAVWAWQYLRLLNLNPEVQEMMDGRRPKEERLKVSIALYLIGYSPELQVEIARYALSQGLTLKQTEVYARQVAAEAGEVRVGVRKRTPADDYKNLRRFVRRIHEDAESVLSMPNQTFEEMFLRRDPKDREAMITDVEACIANLTEIRQVLERLKER